VLSALDPRDGKPWDVYLDPAKLSNLAGRKWAAQTLAYIVPEVLSKPASIYVGIRGEWENVADDCWLCYVGFPAFAYYSSTDGPQPPREDEVFLVFLTSERRIYTWRWEKRDPLDDRNPKDCVTRFVRKVWGGP